jgi:hypothetical protein
MTKAKFLAFLDDFELVQPSLGPGERNAVRQIAMIEPFSNTAGVLMLPSENNPQGSSSGLDRSRDKSINWSDIKATLFDLPKLNADDHSTVPLIPTEESGSDTLVSSGKKIDLDKIDPALLNSFPPAHEFKKSNILNTQTDGAPSSKRAKTAQTETSGQGPALQYGDTSSVRFDHMGPAGAFRDGDDDLEMFRDLSNASESD